MTKGRIDYWRYVGAPTQESLLLLSYVFNVPLEYLWPAMPEDGVRLDRDVVREALQHYLQHPPKTEEERAHYEALLDIERRLGGIGYVTFNLLPTPKLVCVLERLPLKVDDLPGWTSVWDGGSLVLPLDGVKPADPVYAYRLPAKVGEFERGALVVFTPLYTDPDPKHLVIGVHKQLPHIARGADWPPDATPLGRIITSLHKH